MNNSEQNEGSTIRELIEHEESLQKATEEAQDDLAQGKTTEAVFEDLQARYFIAKQAREDFQANAQN